MLFHRTFLVVIVSLDARLNGPLCRPFMFCVLNDNHLSPKAIEIFSYEDKGKTDARHSPMLLLHVSGISHTEAWPFYLSQRESG